MIHPLLQTVNLTKKYGNFTALDQVSIQLEKGNIYGIIGQNGAGKTTLMRLLAGLSMPTTGNIILMNKKNIRDVHKARKNIGTMIEYPSIIPYMTAKENLQLHKKLRKIDEKDCENELLRLVGLSENEKKKAKDFSLGMKQRLGIAITLLGNPQLLILDEPMNGLDPVGVTEIRKLLLELCQERDMTILISSHNLPELYQIATQYIIIEKGRILKSMSSDELDRECSHHLLIGCKQLDELVHVLTDIMHTDKFKITSDNKVVLYDFLGDIEYISKTLFENGITVTTFHYKEETLENYFLTLIGGGGNG